MSQFNRTNLFIWILLIGLELSGFCSESSIKVALIHWNPSFGDLRSNINQLNMLVEEAFKNNAQIVLTPELSLSGYSLTKDQALSLAIENPFSELIQIQNLASLYQGYVFVGAVEKAEGNHLYNSVIMFGPAGPLTVSRKRGTAGWNDRGNLPIKVIHTPIGNFAVVICSDTYLPDMSRIAAVKGADVLLVPANWWGNAGQEKIWRVRAIENGLWVMVNNRWGTELDSRYSHTYTYDMNDATSLVIDPSGKVELSYRKKDDDKATGNVILYSDIQINRGSIGGPSHQTYTLSMRNPAAYASLRNDYYQRGPGYKIMKDLPDVGKTNIAIANFSPGTVPKDNIKIIENFIKTATKTIDALILPALAVTDKSTKFEKIHFVPENELFEKEVDSESERLKNLNEYYPFDLDDLLSFIIYLDPTAPTRTETLFTHAA